MRLRRALVWTSAAVVAAFAAAAGLHAQPDLPEYKLKAAFLSKFPQFVEWPAEMWRTRTRLEICVARPNPFSSTLTDLVSGESLGGHPFAVRDVDSDEPLAPCQVLFIAGPATSTSRTMLRRTAGQPVLTVGDRPDFLNDGGVIALQVVDGRVRFDVNAEAAERNGLRLSSQLLRLARVVRGARP
jgi:hypothetical protein